MAIAREANAIAGGRVVGLQQVLKESAQIALLASCLAGPSPAIKLCIIFEEILTSS